MPSVANGYIERTYVCQDNLTLYYRDSVSRMIQVKLDLHFVEVAVAGHVPQLEEPESPEAIDAFLAGI